MEVAVLTHPNIHKSEDKENLEIDITDDREWVELIGKTASEICDDPTGNRIKLNEQHNGLIIESNDAGALGCIGWSIERHLNDIPSKLKPTFRKIMDETKAKKEYLETP
jgi:hypothetical protein